MNEQEIREMIADLEARDAAETLEQAVGWIAVSVSTRYGSLVHCGPFENVADALAYASKWEEQMKEDGDVVYRVDVKPIFAPTENLL